MTTVINISADQTTSAEVTQSDTTVNVQAGVSLHTTSAAGVTVGSTYSNVILDIAGEIISDASTGVNVNMGATMQDGVAPVLTVADTGHIKSGGYYGVLFSSNGGGSIQNAGLIEGNAALAISGEDTVIANTGEIKGGNVGLTIGTFSSDVDIVNSGKISATYVAVELDGQNATMENHGEISGQNGVRHYSSGGEFSNDGSIAATSTGIYLGASHAAVTNSGQISGATGIAFWDDHLTLTNSDDITGTNVALDIGWQAHDTAIVNTGTISSTGTAIQSAGGALTLINSGTISGDIQLGDAAEKTVNKGSMTDIDLGAGKDLFDGRGGTVSGEAHGGLGDDTFVVSSKLSLTEALQEGTDTVKSTISWTLGDNFDNLTLLGGAKATAHGNELANTLTGNSGNNKLFGMADADYLSGGKGDDILTGGTEADRFIFKSHFGKDVIADFENGSDHIDLSHWAGVDSFADLQAHHLTVSGNDLVIHNSADTLTLHDTKAADLDASDFVF